MRWSRYIFFSVSSQFLNAGTNALLTILLARALSRHGFGALALALTVYPLVVAGFRGICLEPAVIHGHGAGLHRRVFADSLRAGLLCLVLTATLPAIAGGSFELGALLGVGAALAVLEEAGRWLLARSERPHYAAAADLAWAAVQVGILSTGFGSPTVVAFSWALGAAASVLVAWVPVFLLGRRNLLLIPEAPPPLAGPDGTTAGVASSGWFASRSGGRRQHMRRSRRYNWNWGLEYLTAASTPQIVLLLAPIAGSVSISGAISAAMTLTGAATVLGGGAQQLLAARLRLVSSVVMLRRWALIVAGVLAVAVLCCTVPLLWIPASWGRHLLGASWPSARSVLPAIIVQKTAVALTLGPIFVTRRLPTYRAGLVFRLPLTVLTIAAALGGVVLDGAPGAAFALAAGAVVSVVIWTIIILHLTRFEGEMDQIFQQDSVRSERA